MKRVLICMLAVLAVAAFSACGNDAEINNDDKDTEITLDKESDNQQNDSNDSNSGESENHEDDNESAKPVTVEELKNTKETSASSFDYDEVDGGIAITNYIGDDRIVVIPEKIDGKAVVIIDDFSFDNKEDIIALKIPDTVVTIGNSAFLNCSGLETFVSGTGLKNIGEYAFSYCEKMVNIDLNYGLETLGGNCFFATDSLREIYIPETVKNIDNPFIKDKYMNATIHSESGSAIEAYAIENGIDFRAK